MAANDVTFTVKAKDANFIATMLAAQAAADGVGEKLAAAPQRGRRSSEDMRMSLQGVTGELGSVALGFVGIGSALQGINTAAGLIRAEWEQWQSRRTSAAEKTTSVAAKRQEMYAALGTEEALAAEGDIAPLEFDRQLGMVAASKGVRIEDAIEAATSALSARGNKSARDVLKALEAVFEAFSLAEADVLATYAGAILDYQKRFGGTPQEALGFAINSAKTARTPSLWRWGKNISPIVSAGGALGLTAEEAGGTAAYFSQASNDITGERSGTATVQFADQIQTALAQNKEAKGLSFIDQLDWLASGLANSDAETLRTKLLGNRRVAEDGMPQNRFLRKDPELHGEQKEIPHMALLIQRTPEGVKARGELRKYIERQTTGAAAEREFASHVGMQQSIPEQVTARTGRVLEATTEQQKLADQGVATEGQILMQAEELMRSAGIGWWDAKLLKWGHWFRSGDNQQESLDEGVAYLQRMRQAALEAKASERVKERMRDSVGDNVFQFGRPEATRGRALEEEQQKLIDEGFTRDFDNAIEQFRGLRGAIRPRPEQSPPATGTPPEAPVSDTPARPAPESRDQSNRLDRLESMLATVIGQLGNIQVDVRLEDETGRSVRRSVARMMPARALQRQLG